LCGRPTLRGEGKGGRNRRVLSEDGESKKRWEERPEKTVATLQAASGCYSIVTIRHRTFRIIYIHSGSYVSVQVADAARIADRSFLPDPTSSSVIAPICLTASKSLEPTRDYPEAHNSSSSRLVPNTILRRYPPPAFPTSAFPRPVCIFRITFRPDTISSYGSLQQHYQFPLDRH
jgi:hypothetical protein